MSWAKRQLWKSRLALQGPNGKNRSFLEKTQFLPQDEVRSLQETRLRAVLVPPKAGLAADCPTLRYAHAITPPNHLQHARHFWASPALANPKPSAPAQHGEGLQDWGVLEVGLLLAADPPVLIGRA